MSNLPENWLSLVGALAILAVVAAAAGWITTRIFRGAIRRVAARTTSTWDDRIIDRKAFARLSNAVPAVLVYYGIRPALGVPPGDLAAAGAAATAVGPADALYAARPGKLTFAPSLLRCSAS